MDAKNNVEKMLGLGVVVVTGGINGDTLSHISRSFTELYLRQVQKVTLLISSNGGDGNVALEIYDIIRLYPGDVNCLVVGKAMSAAATIVQACHRRLATPNSKILIHHGKCPEFCNDWLYNEVQLQKFLEHGRAFRERVYKIMEARTGKSREEIQELCFEDMPLYPEQAIKFGLLDGIWDKLLPWNPAEELNM
jgi:ATP-dependent protease ClpP protease subunit